MAAFLRIAGGALDLACPAVVGILNVTPDSFSDGGELATSAAVIDRAAAMVGDGADVLDIGGESTRPGAATVSVDEELTRVLPAIEAIANRFTIPISIDTRRAVVAARSLTAGARLVNDVSGFGDPAMGSVVAKAGAGWILMHMPHDVGAMCWSTRTEGMPSGVVEGLQTAASALQLRVEAAEEAGVDRSQLAIDPGIGFGKSQVQNLGFLRGFGPVAKLDLPILVGPSRKSFLGNVTGKPPGQRVFGTAAAVTAAVLAGAVLIRVHDVAAMRDVVDVAHAIKTAH